MAKQCTKCGKSLPREDTRYCNNCGKTFPYTRPVKYALPDEPPAWMKQLENIICDTKPQAKYDNDFVNASATITSTTSSNHGQASNTKSENTEAEPASHDPESVSPQKVSLHNGMSRANADTTISTSEVAQPPKTLTNVPLRELRVKVWEQEEIVKDHALAGADRGTTENEQTADVVEDLPTRPLLAADTPGRTKQPLSISDQTVKSVDDKEIVDDLPTRPLAASLPETPTIRHTSVSPAKSNGHVSHSDEVEELDTRPLVAWRQEQAMSPLVENPAAQRMQAVRMPVEPAQDPRGSVLQRPITPELFSQPQVAPTQTSKHTPPLSVTGPPGARPKRKGRKWPVFVSVFLCILVAGGVSAWLIVFQPFTVPGITNTTQAFQDTGLGLSLRYPQAWTAQLDKINQAVYFYDDNHTDQVNISAVAASTPSAPNAPSTQGINGYIDKEVDLLGITGQKAEPSLSFAGVSWQQVQGNILQSGASYTVVLLVTLHAGHYYTIIQLAPSTTYAQEDHLVFSNMRSSFQFI